MLLGGPYADNPYPARLTKALWTMRYNHAGDARAYAELVRKSDEWEANERMKYLRLHRAKMRELFEVL